MKYYDLFESRADILSQSSYGDSEVPAEDEIVYAGYSYEDYSGNALIVYKRDGKWFENNDSHCSCYGLESWNPEETSAEALLMRKGWPGLTEAIQAELEKGK